MVKAIIFDMDDTLYPEISFVHSGFQIVANYVASKTGERFQHILDKLWEEFNSDRKEVFNRLLNNYNIFSVQELVHLYRTHFPSIALSMDAAEILNFLRNKNKCKIGVLTDGFAQTQINKFTALGLEWFTDYVVFTDILGKEYWKPSTKGFICILDILNTEPENAVYIGDNPAKDFVAPNQLGMLSVFIKRKDGIHTYNPVHPEGKPHYTISSLIEIKNLFFASF